MAPIGELASLMLENPASAVPEQLSLPEVDAGGRVHWHGFHLALGESTMPPWYSTEACFRGLEHQAQGLEGIVNAVDLGCGSGIIALALAIKYKVPRVVAADVARSQVEVAARNIALNCSVQQKKCMEVRQSDVFDAFPTCERFDLIVANLPIDPRPPTQSLLEDFGPFVTSLRDVDYAAHRKLLAQLPQRLTVTGRLLLCASRTLSDADALSDLIIETGLRVAAEQAFCFHTPTPNHPDKTTVYNCLWIEPGRSAGGAPCPR